jgi:phosphoglycerol transferase MdoB-like AlkP superfamily enzyme
MRNKLLKYWNNLELPVSFIRLLLINTLIISLFRVFETTYILIALDRQKNLIPAELLGLIYDIFTINALLILFLPLYIWIKKRSEYWVDTLFLNGIGFFSLLHIPILIYFLYQLELLDFFMWNTSVDESFFTMRSSGISYFALFVPVLMISLMLTLLRRGIKDNKIPWFFHTKRFARLFLAIALILQVVYIFSFNRFTASKSLHLFAKSAIYAVTPKEKGEHYTEADAFAFRNLDKSKLYLDTEYPLLHLMDTTNRMGPYFHKFERPPNVVILIVEGLGDDFIHAYRGLEFMPNLKQISKEGLYWSRCFTLGERSYAVVPSLLGSLPYGEIGFSIMEKYPRHLTLVPFLKSNGYHTAYFYGQIAWFHQKERFFKYNHIDLIFDKRNYAKKYKKALVGTEKFFWGYHDLNLFLQGLEVIDTLPEKPQLNIFFTGSMHAPFVISDKTQYDKRFNAMLKRVKSEKDLDFFKAYDRYFKSILFFDDALGKFLKEYKKKPGFENTIFLLTGDHHMSEIPAKNPLKRYHVPLIIFGEKLKQSAVFKHEVSHLDFYETLIPFLSPYIQHIPSQSAALGTNLFNTEARYLAFMNNNREIREFYHDGLYLKGNDLFKVNEQLDLGPVKDNELKYNFKQKFRAFKKTNAYVSLQDKIMPDSIFCESVRHQCLLKIDRKEKSKFTESKHVLVETLDVPSKKLFFDIDFRIENRVNDLQLVYVLKDEFGKVRLRRKLDIKPRNNYYREYLSISPLKQHKGPVSFEAYIHNPKNKEITYSVLRVFIHSEK